MILETDKELLRNLRAQVPGGASLIALPDSVHLLLIAPKSILPSDPPHLASLGVSPTNSAFLQPALGLRPA